MSSVFAIAALKRLLISRAAVVTWYLMPLSLRRSGRGVGRMALFLQKRI